MCGGALLCTQMEFPEITKMQSDFVSMHRHNFIRVVWERFIELRHITTIYKLFKCMFLVNAGLTFKSLRIGLEISEY